MVIGRRGQHVHQLQLQRLRDQARPPLASPAAHPRGAVPSAARRPRRAAHQRTRPAAALGLACRYATRRVAPWLGLARLTGGASLAQAGKGGRGTGAAPTSEAAQDLTHARQVSEWESTHPADQARQARPPPRRRPVSTGGGTRRVQLVRKEGRDVSS